MYQDDFFVLIKSEFMKNMLLVVFFLVFAFFLIPSVLVGKTNFENQFVTTYYEHLGDKFFAHREVMGHWELSQKYYLLALASASGKERLHWKNARIYWDILVRGDDIAVSLPKWPEDADVGLFPSGPMELEIQGIDSPVFDFDRFSLPDLLVTSRRAFSVASFSFNNP